MLREALQVSKKSEWLQIVTKNLFQDLPPRGSRKTHTLEATDCRCCMLLQEPHSLFCICLDPESEAAISILLAVDWDLSVLRR